MKVIKTWLIPIVVASGLFILIRPTFAQVVQGEDVTLSDYLLTNDVEVAEETVDGHRQIYYDFKGKNFITAGNDNSNSPSISGNYIAYIKVIEGMGQVILYDLSSDTSIQLTNTSTNNAPIVSKNGKVVWEGWIDESQKWQVFSFDGTSVKQLTAGDLSISPFIEGDNIVYARRDTGGEWRSVVYNLIAKKEIDVAFGAKSQYSKLRSGKIVFALPNTGEEEFPLTAEDIFTLDLAPLTASESAKTVTSQDILDELNATPSAVFEESPTSTPSGEISPASGSGQVNP